MTNIHILSSLWAAFALNVIASIALARLADLVVTRAGRWFCGGLAIGLSLMAIAILLSAVTRLLG